MYGVKPWQGIRNHDVISRVERGERLRRPECCPESLYTLLMSMWSVEPFHRPTMLNIKQFMEHLLEQIDRNISFDKLKAPYEYFEVFLLF